MFICLLNSHDDQLIDSHNDQVIGKVTIPAVLHGPKEGLQEGLEALLVENGKQCIRQRESDFMPHTTQDTDLDPPTGHGSRSIHRP